jgi:hypothetical protein
MLAAASVRGFDFGLRHRRGWQNSKAAVEESRFEPENSKPSRFETAQSMRYPQNLNSRTKREKHFTEPSLRHPP